MGAGLSVRMIAGVTDIPPSSVHRAMMAIAKAEAKKELAAIDSSGGEGEHERQDASTTVPKQASGRQTEGSHRKLADDVLAHLGGSWQQHGREALARLRTERPNAYFKAIVRLMKIFIFCKSSIVRYVMRSAGGPLP